jgi:hypothetical protein
MRNRIAQWILTTGIALVLLLLPGTVSAAYDCLLNYGAGDAISDLNACCHPQGGESATYQGQECRSGGEYLTNFDGLNCSAPATIQTKANPAKTANKKFFNCWTGATSGCRVGFCPDGGTCKAVIAPDCTNATRNSYCPSGCGACVGEKVYCYDGDGDGVSDEFSYFPRTFDDISNPLSPSYVSCQESLGVAACAAQWRTVKNPCTGECSGCPSGLVPSGWSEGSCISFTSRFAEILTYGLAVLGGPSSDGVYDYSSSTGGPISQVFLKADASQALDWSDETVPVTIQNLYATNYYFCSVDGDCPAVDMTCTDGGLCITEGATGAAGQVCVNYSDCHLGFICDTSGKCADPEAGLVACTTPGQVGTCVGGLSCGADLFCHDMTASPGDPCTSNAQCSDEQFCNNDSTRVCESKDAGAPIGKSLFVGLTGAVDGNEGSYQAVDALCATAHAGSHVCNSKEIIDSVVQSVTALTGVTTVGWINAAAPGNISPAVNDCKGWTNAGWSPYYGTVWNFTSNASGIQPCATSHPFACCK